MLGFEQHPLLGTVSSLSIETGVEVHHPGPLLFDALALPARLLGSDLGVPLVVGCLNAICAWWIVSIVGRVGGLAARLATAVGIALMTWTMSWPLLIEPWNPHVAMLPALLFLVAAGLLTLGEPKAALPAVVGLSLALQTHIGYVYIVGFTLVAMVGVWVVNRRTGLVRTERWTRQQRIVPLLVLGALWIQPIIEVIVHRGDSNIAAMLESAGTSATVLGPLDAQRVVAAVVALPPWWLPAGFDGPTIFDPPPAALPSAAALATLLVALLALAVRGPTRMVRAFARFVGVLLPLAVVSIGLVPISATFGFSRNQWRWLWPLSLLVTLVLAWTICVFVRRRSSRRIENSTLVAAAITACACAALLNLTTGERLRPIEQQQSAAIARMVSGLPFEELQECTTVAVDFEPGFAPPGLVAPSVMLALRERDIDFVPTALDSMAHLDRRPQGDEDCQLTLAEQPGEGRVVATLAGPLALGVTLTAPD